MVDPTTCLPKAAVELADIVRRFAPEYTLQYGHVTMPSQKRALSDIAACCTEDRSTDTWRTMRLSGVEFLRRFLQHVLPRGFHRVRYYGLWHHSKRDLSNRAWLLLILDKPTHTAGPAKIADLLEALSQLAEIDDSQDMSNEGDDNTDTPCCPHCGSERTTFLGERPRPRMP